MPDNTAIVAGSYKPANYEPGDPFPAPAPTPTGNVALSTFDGTNPNGTWSLYVVDDVFVQSVRQRAGGSRSRQQAGRLRLLLHLRRRHRPHLRLHLHLHTSSSSATATATPPVVRCVVPRVIGMTIRKARTRIRAKHCTVGRIRRARSKRAGRVIAQSPRPGRRLARGSRVSLVLGRR